ncbi:conserved hypothetical protein [Kribbella flavida DSM 17836]|uniref:DUF4865 domain-containing protein n=1 Tax=Kribbella flavida (strain DSM 17836 / JCM 10339 / NBRC 14399) TaxID=479435 RepID=D2Q3P3_KRIFD|nr:DUF4865 family protein [Kribbella flavida]ADB35915.1 conserved hypothetical protein [Kribbella flavida DSM 17836]
MQYELTLPADYDMGTIRRRVLERGHATDDFEGLGLKAYLVQDQANGAAVNQYAPFYLWNDTAGMSRFLWGGGFFTGICRSFGRPSVRHWTGVEALGGPDVDQQAVAATKHIVQLPPDVDPAGPVAEAMDGLRRTAQLAGVHSSAIAVDPGRWELVQFTLWSGEPGIVPGTRYQVLHLSTPGTKDLLVA